MGNISKYISIMAVTVFIASILFLDILRVNESVASVLGLPEPTQMLDFTADSPTAVLLGLKVNPDNPLEFDFLLEGQGDQTELRESASDMINYFLAALTFEKDSLWVNLSPYESDRIIEDDVALTELGQDMLEQDYILKQLVSSATYPESELGESYWKSINSRISSSANSFNKVWIVSKEASVLEHNGMVIIEKAELEAKTEADYFAQSKGLETSLQANSDGADNAINEIIIPRLNKELNNGKHFAKLRRMYSSIILAQWFKQKFVESFFANYLNKAKTSGIDTADKDSKEKIFNLYSEAFNKGVYNVIKNERNKSGVKVKRKYFSGGNAVSSSMQLKTSSSGLANFKNFMLEITKGDTVRTLKVALSPRQSAFATFRNFAQTKAYYEHSPHIRVLSNFLMQAYGISKDKQADAKNALNYVVYKAEHFATEEQSTEKENEYAFKFIMKHATKNKDLSISDFFSFIMFNYRYDNFSNYHQNKDYEGAIELLFDAGENASEEDKNEAEKYAGFKQEFKERIEKLSSSAIEGEFDEFLDEWEMPEISPFAHEFKVEDYAIDFIDDVLGRLSWDADRFEEGFLSIDYVEDVIRQLILDEIDLDDAVKAMDDSITKMELVVAMRRSMNEMKVFSSYEGYLPENLNKYRSMIPNYLAIFDYLEDSPELKTKLTYDDLVETLFNIEKNILRFVYDHQMDEMTEIVFNILVNDMNETMNSLSLDIKMLEILGEAEYGKFESYFDAADDFNISSAVGYNSLLDEFTKDYPVDDVILTNLRHLVSSYVYTRTSLDMQPDAINKLRSSNMKTFIAYAGDDGKDEKRRAVVNFFRTLDKEIEKKVGGIDLKGLKINSSSNSTDKIKFAAVDMTGFDGFRFKIVSLETVDSSRLLSWLD